MSDKIMNQYVEAGCPDGELDQGRAIHWAGNEIDRLKAELAERKHAYETVISFHYKEFNRLGAECDKLRAELAEKERELAKLTDALRKDISGCVVGKDNAALRKLCGEAAKKIADGGDSYPVYLRLLAAGRGDLRRE